MIWLNRTRIKLTLPLIPALICVFLFIFFGCIFANVKNAQAITVNETYYITDSNDDQKEDSAGNLNATDIRLLNGSEWGGYRFTNVNIPQGATILSATIEVYLTDSCCDNAQEWVHFEDVDDAAVN